MTNLVPKCGGCGSTLMETQVIGGTAYGVCMSCQRLQETETRTDPNRELCDNCACRPNSPERQDFFGWMRWNEKHVEDGVPFYCHKGMGAELAGSALKYLPDEDESKWQPCAGWLSRRAAHLARNPVPSDEG